MGAVSLAERGIVGEATMGDVVPLFPRRERPVVPQFPEPSDPTELPDPTDPNPDEPLPAARIGSITELSIKGNVNPERPRPIPPKPEPAPPIPKPRIAGEMGLRRNSAERQVGTIAKVTELRPGVAVSLAKPVTPQRRVA